MRKPKREPKNVHPLLEHTPSNHLIQVVDAPIRESFYYLLFEMPDNAFLNDVRAGRKVYFLCLNDPNDSNDLWSFHAYDLFGGKFKNFLLSPQAKSIDHMKMIMKTNKNYQPENRFEDFLSTDNSIASECIKRIAPIAKKYQSKKQPKKIAIQDAGKYGLDYFVQHINKDPICTIPEEKHAFREYIKILVCNTQHPHSFKDGQQLETDAISSARFGQLIDTIKRVKKDEDEIKCIELARGRKAVANPAIYTFLAVHPKMLEHIEKHFSANEYHIIKQSYGGETIDASLITVLKKSVVNSANPLASGLCQGRVQSLMCTLANTKKQFVLHLAHLPRQGNDIDQNVHIDQVEREIINTIFSHETFSLYPQILTGDLNITLNSEKRHRNIATSIVPQHIIDSGLKDFNGNPIPCWDRTIGTLTLPALNPNKTSAPVKLTFYKAIQTIELESHEAIDPKTGLIYRPSTYPQSDKSLNEPRLFSRFGKKYRRFLNKTLETIEQDYTDNEYLKNAIQNQQGYVRIYLDRNQNNDSTKINYIDNNNRIHLFFNYDEATTQRNEALKALDQMHKGKYQIALELEEAVKEHCSCKWTKEKDIFYIQFSFKQGGQLVTQYLSQIYNGDKFKLPMDELTEDMAKHLVFLIKMADFIEDHNNDYCGLITLTFKPQLELGTSIIHLKFFSNFIKDLVSTLLDEIHSDGIILESITRSELSLSISYDDFARDLGDASSESTLWEAISNQIKGALDTVYYGIKPSLETADVIFSKKALPHTLTQHFTLTLREITKNYFFYTLPEKISYADIANFLIIEMFKSMENFYSELRDYKGTKTAYKELQAIFENNNPEPLAEHCNQKIKLSEKASKSWHIFNAPKIDKQTDLLYKSFLKSNILANLEFSFYTTSRIQTLQQSINTQEKRELYELCVKERERDGGEPYNKIRKNSALLLLEHHLILSHPEYTANDVWEHIKAKPVEHYGTGKNYPHESGDGELILGDILKPIKGIWNTLSSLVTSNDVTTHASETLSK